MPFPNEHSGRVKNPDLFVSTSFRRKEITDGVSIVIGKLRSDPDGSMVVQTYRFNATQFTAEQARKWLKDHNVNPISFEPATNKSFVTILVNSDAVNFVVWKQKSWGPIPIHGKGEKGFTLPQRISQNQKDLNTLVAKSSMINSQINVLNKKINKTTDPKEKESLQTTTKDLLQKKTNVMGQIQKRQQRISDLTVRKENIKKRPESAKPKEKVVETKKITPSTTSHITDTKGNPVNVSIGQATQEDLKAFDSGLWENSYFARELQYYGSNFSNSLKVVKAEQDIGSVKKGSVIAGIAVSQQMRVRGLEYTIEYLEVAPTIRGTPGMKTGSLRGVGTSLILDAVKDSKKKGFSGKINLYAAQNAIPFYKKLGFTSFRGDSPDMTLSAVGAYDLLEKFGI